MRAVLIAALLCPAAFGQGLSDSTLTNVYCYFRHLMVLTNPDGSIAAFRTAYGNLTFLGDGRYTFTGSQIVASSIPVAVSGTGTYSVGADGYIVMSNPQRDGANMRVGLGMRAFVGATTEAPGVRDLFVAFRALTPTATQPGGALTGSWDFSGIEIPTGSQGQLRSAAFRLTPTGAGTGGSITMTTRSSVDANRLTTIPVNNVTFTLTPQATGTITFPGSGLVNGTRTFVRSMDGSLILMGSADEGMHSLWVGTQAQTGVQSNSDFRGLYFRAGIRIDGGRPGCYSGSANANGSGKLVSSLRVRQNEGVLDLTTASDYQLSADATGMLSPGRMALGATAFQANALGTADTGSHELSVGITPIGVSGTGVFVNPRGIVNAGSFAPVGAPLSPGGFITIFGSGMAAAAATASALPFPLSLSGVQVLINDSPAPVYSVSSGQISAMVPLTVTGDTVNVAVLNGAQRSNTVTARLARTSPGIFTVPPAGTGPGALLHANYTLVSANLPARRGETVLLYLTGLGTVIPAVPTGSAAPSNPLSTVTYELKVYVGGRQAAVVFKGLAPGLAGLYQINFTVPAGAPTGSAVPLAIETPDAFHDMADIAVGN